MAITWRNLTQPGAAAAGYLMQGAQRSLDSGFGALQAVLDQRNKTEQANWGTQKANNTTDYLNAVADVKDPTQMQDPQVQANLAAMKQQFGYQVDSQAIRGAADKRVQDLQQQGLQRIEFNDKTRVDGERDQVDAIAGLYQAGKYAEGDALRAGKNFRDDAVLDKMRVDAQRGYSQESRAQQDQVWQGQDHALTQKVGKANLDFTTLQRKDLVDTQNRAKAGNEQLNNAMNGWVNTQDQITGRTNDIAKGLGIQVSNGVPILDDSPDGQAKQAEFTKALKAEGLDSSPSATQLRNTFVSSLRKDPNNKYTEAEISKFSSQFDDGLLSQGSLSKIDQAELDSKNALVTANAEADLAKEAQRWDIKSKGNKFLSGLNDPTVTIDDITTSLKNNNFGPWSIGDSGNREKFIKVATKYSTEGISVNGQVYKVPPPMLKTAMAMTAGDWTDPADGLTSALATMIGSDPKAYKESLELLAAHQDLVNNKKADTLRALNSNKSQALGKAGVSPSANRLVQALNGAKQ